MGREAFNDEHLAAVTESVTALLAFQMTLVKDHSIQDEKGRINKKAIGYIFGFVDGALQRRGQDIRDLPLGIPVLYQVLRHLFPNREEACMTFLIKNQKDEMVVLGMTVGGQQYFNFTKPDRGKGGPMGLARFILEGAMQKNDDSFWSVAESKRADVSKKSRWKFW